MRRGSARLGSFGVINFPRFSCKEPLSLPLPPPLSLSHVINRDVSMNLWISFNISMHGRQTLIIETRLLSIVRGNAGNDSGERNPA